MEFSKLFRGGNPDSLEISSGWLCLFLLRPPGCGGLQLAYSPSEYEFPVVAFVFCGGEDNVGLHLGRGESVFELAEVWVLRFLIRFRGLIEFQIEESFRFSAG